MKRTAFFILAVLIGSAGYAWAEEPTSQPFTLPPVATDDKPAADGNLFAQAAAEAKQKMDAAQAAVTKQLEKSPAYLTAKMEVAKQTSRLEEAKKNGELQDRIDAMRDLTAARRNLTALEKEKLSQNAEYAEAKKQYDSLSEVSKAPQGGTDTSKIDPSGSAPISHDPATADAIQMAIVNHAFLIGMTLQECIRSAGATPQVMSSSDPNTRTYRWSIRGVIGSHHVSERTLTGYRTYHVTDYGTVGYVYATFVDGKLTAFDRRR